MNRTHTALRELRHDDSGASLILVMALLMFVGLVTTATLNYAQTSLGTTDVLEGRVAQDYDVDGALQVGVNRIRTSNFLSSKSSGGALDSPPAPIVVPGTSGEGDVVVTFQPVTATGSNEALATSPRRTSQATLATATAAVLGEVGVARTTNGKARVAGPLASNGSIAASSGEIEADGAIRATGGCSGTVTSLTNDKNCSSGATAVPVYTQPTGSITERSVPTCPGDGSTIEFQPGLYTDAAALSNLVNTCTASTFWFPGATGGKAYFFDFRDGETSYACHDDVPLDDPNRLAKCKVWRLYDGATRVVGGGTTAPGPPESVSIPGACQSPLTNADNKGVVFVFGGASQLQVDAGQVELCGPGDAAGGDPPIALFGGDTRVGGVGGSGALGPDALPATPPPSASLTNGTLTMLNGTGANVGSDAAFGNNTNQKNRIRPWDNSVASASLTNTNRRASVRVSGYSPSQAVPSDTVPAGATLTYAKAYVRHREQESGSASFRHVHLTVTPSGSGTPVGPVNVGGTSTPGLSPTNSSTYQRGTVDLLSTPALQDWVTDNGFSGADVVWSVELSATGSESATMALDSILIVMGWEADAGFRPQSTTDIDPNCVGRPTTVYPGAGACAMIKTTGGQLYVQGTGYAERGAFDLAHTDIKAPVFASGLIGRQLRLTTTNHTNYDGPVINRPRPLEMLVRAYTCPEGGCGSPPNGPEFNAPWLLSGSATATYTDPGGSVTAGNREVAVDSWWIRR